MAKERLQVISSHLAIGTALVDPDSEVFPKRSQLPVIPGAPKGAAWIWGKDDEIGRLNLLTSRRVAKAAQEVKQGIMIPLNLELGEPNPPQFGREAFRHSIKTLQKDVSYDDLYTLNTQSGTQWDGFRHFSHIPTKSFYNNVKTVDIVGDKANAKCGIGAWSKHGIAGRGVLLDYAHYARYNYNPTTSHAITYDELIGCAKAQNTTFQPGDILIIRSGWTKAYNEMTYEQRTKLRKRSAGIEQSDKMLDFLHDNYFSAVAGDAPAFECWPPKESYYMHEHLLALWGVPIGEFFDLEELSKQCQRLGRYTFFLTSSPANVPGSHANAIAFL